jgi:hypothetical protein
MSEETMDDPDVPTSALIAEERGCMQTEDSSQEEVHNEAVRQLYG